MLLRASLDAGDVHSVFGDVGAPKNSHGTQMAGLALFPALEEDLLGASAVVLRHRLESVKFLPDDGENNPSAYGLVTAQAVALPEATARRARVFCMPVTAIPDRIGAPSLWSASVDALSTGVDISSSDDGIALLGRPEPDASRLFFVSAGNVDPGMYAPNYRDISDVSPVQDPAHSWNAVAVGAYTELDGTPEHPDYAGWTPVASAGDISPHSTTSVLFDGRQWPIKPDICMEGGNLLVDGSGLYEPHPLVSLRTTDGRDDMALTSAHATSAATAQAARLGALVQAQYPEYWPESVRGLIVHAAQWTPAMRTELNGAKGKTERLTLVRRYGWGVPTQAAVLDSSSAAVTMVTQHSFSAFSGADFRMPYFRLHRLPWPREVLETLGAEPVTMRVTLSYFIEPNASRRGWRRRYAYASHSLRFELKTPVETVEAFVQRVNRDAQAEDDGMPLSRDSGSERWFLGANQRNTGSLHQDEWTGIGADLAASGVLAVHAIGGWWKYAKREDRVDQPVRYSLVVSLRTGELDVDLYTPVEIANEQLVPTPIEIGLA